MKVIEAVKSLAKTRTQQWIADKAGVDQATISRILGGVTKRVEFELGFLLIRLASDERSNGKSASGPIGPTNHNSKRNRERRAIARDRSLAESTGRSK